MPSGSAVHVRFYGQPWDNATHDFGGPAFVINEVTLDPIPGFNSPSGGGQQPNWELASTALDTTDYADTYLVFWVVVWMEQNGALVAETAGHGLTALPGLTTAPTALAIERYSNNVGSTPAVLRSLPESVPDVERVGRRCHGSTPHRGEGEDHAGPPARIRREGP
jgi:hypothetical protein